MRVAKDDELGRLGRREIVEGHATESCPAVARARGSAGMGGPEGDTGREVGGQPSKRPDGEWVPQEYVAEGSVAAVLHDSKAVAVLHAGLPTAQRADPGTHMIVGPEVISDDVAAPAIVVPGDPENGNAGVVQGCQGSEDADSGARDDGAPLVPEFEQVAVDEQGRRSSGQRFGAPGLEEVEEGAVKPGRGGGANMGV